MSAVVDSPGPPRDVSRRDCVGTAPDSAFAAADDDPPSGRKQAADDGSMRCLDWFQTHGAA